MGIPPLLYLSSATAYLPTVYSTCLYCTRNLGVNDVLETLPIGRRVVFDPEQGRLWVVCRSCAKWNLVPFDTRLETIDACERIFSDTRTRFSTDHIGLARLREGLDLVRIGAPQRPEFASWRYGAQYRRRRRHTLAAAGAGALAGAVLLIGARFSGIVASSLIGGMWQLPRTGWHLVRDRRRRVTVRLPDAAGATTLKTAQLESAHIDLSDGEMQVRFLRPRERRGTGETASVTGEEARLVTRRIVAALNDTVGSAAHLSDAITRLESNAMEPWLRAAAARAMSCKPGAKSWMAKERWHGFGDQALRLAPLEPADRLAVEMWLSEEDEAKALAGELALLERQWREAEELARIADALAVSDEVNQRLSSAR